VKGNSRRRPRDLEALKKSNTHSYDSMICLSWSKTKRRCVPHEVEIIRRFAVGESVQMWRQRCRAAWHPCAWSVRDVVLNFRKRTRGRHGDVFTARPRARRRPQSQSRAAPKERHPARTRAPRASHHRVQTMPYSLFDASRAKTRRQAPAAISHAT
jgi:hypothetical protein